MGEVIMESIKNTLNTNGLCSAEGGNEVVDNYKKRIEIV